MMWAFADMEPDVRDLARMARLAELQLHEAIGELPCKDGKYIETPDCAAAEPAIFAVSKMAEMAKQLEQTYDCLYADAARAA
jgi:hypothetical protein